MKFILFVIVAMGIVVLSWPSLLRGRGHGFYRFFAFESILALVGLNSTAWFKDPWSPRQLAAWSLLVASLILVTHGIYLLLRVGRPSGRIENTTVLVRRGAYQYIRHPLYSSLLFLAWGAFLKDVSPLSLCLVLAATGALLFTARVEEAENLQRFGDEYTDYMRQTKRFIPFLF